MAKSSAIPICFVIGRWETGGIQRNLVNLVPELRRLGFEPFVAVARGIAKDDPFPTNELKIVELGASGHASLTHRLARLFSERRPVVALVSGSDTVAALIARRLASSPPRVVFRQHNHFRASLRKRFVGAKLAVYAVLLPRADAVVAVSEGVADDLNRTLGLPRERIEVIYNPIVPKNLATLVDEPVTHPFFVERTSPTFVGVGRLVEQKDFATLIAGFAAYRRRAEGRLVFVGDGPKREELAAQAAGLGIANDVAFVGFDTNPYRYMARATCVVVTSAWEGFCNVIAEALAVGAPVVRPIATMARARFSNAGSTARWFRSAMSSRLPRRCSPLQPGLGRWSKRFASKGFSGRRRSRLNLSRRAMRSCSTGWRPRRGPAPGSVPESHRRKRSTPYRRSLGADLP